MATVAFDTLKFAQTLRDKAKFTPEQAEGVAQAFSDASGEQLVTQAVLKEELSPIKHEFAVMRWMLGFTLAAVMAVLYILIRR
jgi:hypothetical protein